MVRLLDLGIAEVGTRRITSIWFLFLPNLNPDLKHLLQEMNTLILVLDKERIKTNLNGNLNLNLDEMIVVMEAVLRRPTRL
jgi:hypothetical protein